MKTVTITEEVWEVFRDLLYRLTEDDEVARHYLHRLDSDVLVQLDEQTPQ